MDIYLCSTIRNLMFAVMRACKSERTQSLILLITDQQDLKLADFDCDVLPAHIQLCCIERKAIRKQLDASLAGRVIRLLAACKITPPTGYRAMLRAKILQQLTGQHSPGFQQAQRLFLFNDRNRVARLLRLAFGDYVVIEDGLANYRGYPLRWHEQLGRLLGRRHGMRYIGDDVRCGQILLLHPEKSPCGLRNKIAAIDFHNSEQGREVCLLFFRVPTQSINSQYDLLLATQPISEGNLTQSDADLAIYRQIIALAAEAGRCIAIKVHPRERAQRYQQAFPASTVISGNIPLELMLFGTQHRVDILSIYSSAGLGFEQFCKRLCLVKDAEAEAMDQLFILWQQQPERLIQRIDGLLRAE